MNPMNLTMPGRRISLCKPRCFLAAGALALAAALPLSTGCRANEDPGGYSRQRPPADRLDKRDRGLQSYDILAAADQMAQSLLTLPEIQNSPERLTVVVDRAMNETSTYPRDLQIFLEQLKVELGRRARNRIQLIANRDDFRDFQARELEQRPGDEFGGAGAGRTPPGPAGIQPDYVLHSEVRDLPNRGTTFYQFVFELTDLQGRTILWNDSYDVRVAR